MKFISSLALTAIALTVQSCSQLIETSTNATFFVAADTHFDPPPETDQYYHIKAMNALAGNAIWPSTINGKPTLFQEAGQKIEEPRGVILVGDIINQADSASLSLFRQRYEKGTGDKQIHYPVYIGLGNHDINPVIDEPAKTNGCKRMFAYLEERHKGKNAPVPVDNFDTYADNYSWNWGSLHLVETNLFAGANLPNRPGNLEWLSADLAKYANKNQPVIIFQHYGVDSWALTWWTDAERKALFNILKQYNVVGIFTGHTHTALNIKYEGFNFFQVNNAWNDDDGKGSFAVVRITNKFIDMATCRWTDGEGHYEWVEPFFHAAR